jgi:PQQ-dependent dehydrogenase (methanol/ethanol family)
MNPRPSLRPLLFCLLAFPAIHSIAQQASDFSADRLAQLPSTSWHTNGGNLYNQRYSPLMQIDRTNVAQLKGVWHIHLNSGNGPQYSGEGQPLVYDGVAYVVTGADDVFAVDVATGKVRWEYRASLPEAMTTVCCGWTSRGVGMSEEHIYVGQLDGQLKALDRATGEVVWTTQAERWQDGYTITAAPLYYDGLVIVGFAGGEIGTRGRLKAFDAATGALKWTFYTIPEPGEFGSDTWPSDNELWRNGGAPIWSTPAVDPELGLLYFGTGNAGPDSNGAHRAGDNLFTASILALDIKTGEYRWHFQQVHHDIWDYDSPNPVMLFDIELDGAMRKASRRRARPAGCTSSTALPASRSSASRRERCRRTPARKPRRRSPTRSATRSCRSRCASRRKDRRSSTKAKSSRRTGPTRYRSRPALAAARTGRRARTIQAPASRMYAPPIGPSCSRP